MKTPFGDHLPASMWEKVLTWQQMPWPIDWTAEFGREAPFLLEIGFGNGQFLADLATRRPDANILGVEIAWEPVRLAFRRIHKYHLENVRIIKSDALVVLRHMIDQESIDEAFIHHPDPWPKERHHERRIIQHDFLRLLGARMKPDAPLTIATDHAGYAEWMTEVLEAQTLLTSDFDTTAVHEIPGRIQTKYERKGRERGDTIHFYCFRKTGTDTSPPPVRALGVEPMPNVTFKGTIDLKDVFRDFTPASESYEDDGDRIVIKQIDAWHRPRENAWLVETVVRDGPLTQHVGVIVADQNGEKITVKLASMGFPRTTTGSKRAVGKVAEWVATHAPDLVKIAAPI